MAAEGAAGPQAQGSAWDVFKAFLVLGLTSFGGPVAHLGYFREAFVSRRAWLSEAAYADLVALCQVLPGPASSQVGMGIGLHRAGLPGMAAAWTAFTLPSALLLAGFAAGLAVLQPSAETGWLLGLKAAAAAVVAQALIGMAKSLTPDLPRGALAILGFFPLVLAPHPLTPILVLMGGGVLGWFFLKEDPKSAGEAPGVLNTLPRKGALAALAAFAALLALLPLAAIEGGPAAALIDKFYRAGSLVFGGGHVVLPLLQSEMVSSGFVSEADFLAGYGAAQAVPGPLFTFAAFLGYASEGAVTGPLGAALALIAIFLPSALLLLGVLPFWAGLRENAALRRGLAGVNAAVVGLLAAAFYDPVLLEGVKSLPAALIAIGGLGALYFAKVPQWLVVAAAALAGAVLL